jgi:hypothetical protein
VLGGVQVLRCVVTSEIFIFGDVGRVERCDVLCDLENFFFRVARDTSLTYACKNGVHEGDVR